MVQAMRDKLESAHQSNTSSGNESCKANLRMRIHIEEDPACKRITIKLIYSDINIVGSR